MCGDIEPNLNAPSVVPRETASAEKYWLGIDFSGNCRMWRATTKDSNIWIAAVSREPALLVSNTLTKVQELEAEGEPFFKLTSLLKRRRFAAAAVDAPFSVPHAYLPQGGHGELLDLVAKMQRPKNCPFPAANDFVCRVLAGRALRGKKPLRETERSWQKRGVNVRSTLWAGPRGGAAMTSACLTLLRESECPVWPWEQAMTAGLLVEAFPAAQLCHWEMQYERYNGNDSEASSARRKLVESVSARVAPGRFRQELESSADALDAVLCAFAAIAVTSAKLPDLLSGSPDPEGRIAVHE